MIAVTALIAVPLLAAIIGIVPTMLGHPHRAVPVGPTKPASCADMAALSGAATKAASFTFTVTTNCPPKAGNQRVVVVELLNEGVPGTDKHSEYYLAYNLSNTARSQTFANDPNGCTSRLFYVISISDDALKYVTSAARTTGGAYYGEPIDTELQKYVISNTELNTTCNPN